VTNFDIDGCHTEANCEIIGTVLKLKNKYQVECMFKMTSEKAAKRW